MRFVTKLALLSISGALVLAAPATARDRVRIRGGGWGHGIGMSQYGALGRARAGDGPSKIVEHYYSRSQVKRRDMGRIRVGLLQYQRSISVSSEVFTKGGGKIAFKVKGQSDKVASGGPDANFRVEASGTGGMRLFKNGKQKKQNGVGVLGSPAHPLIALYAPFKSMVRVSEKGRAYAYGKLEFGTYPSGRCTNFCLRLVVVQPMQKYLYGLGEVPASWPQAALRAQVIAARSYALDKINRLGQHREPCDCAVFDSTYDQAYVGDSKRTESGQYWDDWKQAVDKTNRKVAVFNGHAIQALYSSSSGGHTEHNENVWGGSAVPYLRGVKDRADAVDDNPNHKWSLEMGFNEFESKLNAAYGIGKLKKFRLIEPFGVSGRVTVVKTGNRGGVKIVGSRKTVRKSGWEIRNLLGLKDTLFRVRIVHGVGRQFRSKHRRLAGATGAPTSRSYPVPRAGKRILVWPFLTTGLRPR
jgi:stage II sporulation protein D